MGNLDYHVPCACGSCKVLMLYERRPFDFSADAYGLQDLIQQVDCSFDISATSLILGSVSSGARILLALLPGHPCRQNGKFRAAWLEITSRL